MATCSVCKKTILFGGKREGDLRFCGDACRAHGAVLTAAATVPDDVLQRQLQAVHSGPCPVCQGHGPVDVHTSHRAMSFVVVTTWKSTPRASCRSCGNKAKLADTALTMALGWWGIPWGLLITPVQIGLNLFGLVSGPDDSRPSPALEQHVRLDLAARMQHALERRAA